MRLPQESGCVGNATVADTVRETLTRARRIFSIFAFQRGRLIFFEFLQIAQDALQKPGAAAEVLFWVYHA